MDKNIMIYIRKAYTPWEWHKVLFQEAKNEGLICFSLHHLILLLWIFWKKLDNPIYKIASFEITDIPLIKYVELRKTNNIST